MADEKGELANIKEDIDRKEDDVKPDFKFERILYRGVSMVKCKEIDDIERMETREDDIWVCSYSRSGTTMTQEMTFLVQTLDFTTANTVYLDDRFPILEYKDDSFPFYRGVKYVDQMTSPGMIKSHLHHFLLPTQLQKGKGRIYESLSQRRCHRNGTGHNCPWSRHVLDFWKRRYDKNVLFLKYEEIVGDKPKAVRQIADFLGRSLTEEDVNKICEYCSVENMKNNPMCNMSYWRDYKKINDDGDGGFINQGKAGTWKQLLTSEMAKKIDKLLLEIQDSGLTFCDC